jgi:predicted nucleotidyltransferase
VCWQERLNVARIAAYLLFHDRNFGYVSGQTNNGAQPRGYTPGEAARTLTDSRIEELTRRLRGLPALRDYRGLTIYVAGSYARGEASAHSDIDLFFICNDQTDKVDERRLKGIRVLSAVIREIEDGMEFPPPSNDGQFLNIIPLSEILLHLGGAEDDYKNHFTARMLLLLESQPVYGTKDYFAVIEALIESYLRDYEDHADDFRVTFLVNDILRFWKTLCLNYEHRRNQQKPAHRIRQKVKNFKLKYSRLLTCFATIALLSSYNTMGKSDLIAICKLRPVPEVAGQIEAILESYAWFLGKTELFNPKIGAVFFQERESHRSLQKRR